jgi:hypothetical protein
MELHPYSAQKETLQCSFLAAIFCSERRFSPLARPGNSVIPLRQPANARIMLVQYLALWPALGTDF